MFLEGCKYVTKERKIHNFLTDDLEISSDCDDEILKKIHVKKNSDEEDSSEDEDSGEEDSNEEDCNEEDSNEEKESDEKKLNVT